jgi:uncharacterized protein
VIAVDTNILVYAHREDSDFFDKASACLQDLAGGSAPWALPWPCLHEFFSVVTHPRIYAPPTPARLALAQIDAWLESPSLVMLKESTEHWQSLRKLLENGKVLGPLVHDARIAALCLEHGVKVLWSADRDFGRFHKLIVRNPLVG